MKVDPYVIFSHSEHCFGTLIFFLLGIILTYLINRGRLWGGGVGVDIKWNNPEKILA